MQDSSIIQVLQNTSLDQRPVNNKHTLNTFLWITFKCWFLY